MVASNRVPAWLDLAWSNKFGVKTKIVIVNQPSRSCISCPFSSLPVNVNDESNVILRGLESINKIAFVVYFMIERDPDATRGGSWM